MVTNNLGAQPFENPLYLKGHNVDYMAAPERANIDSGSFEILSTIEETKKAILEFIDKAIHRYDVCADSKTPSFVFNNENIRKRFLDFKDKKKGIIRYITEITPDNIAFCQEIMKAVELRHIQGLKGVFRVNEKEYQYNAALDDTNQAAILIRSNSKEVINQQQAVFEALWSKAIPAAKRIEELQRAGMSVKQLPESSINESSNTNKSIDLVLNKINGLQQTKEQSKISEQTGIITQDPTNKKRSLMKSKNLQLWSNSTSREYALRFKGETSILAATNESPLMQYTELIEEADYLEDVKYDWEYTLKHWKSTRSRYGDKSSINRKGRFSEEASVNNSEYNMMGNTSKDFKCHFCKLTFHSQSQRRKHEEALHPGSNSSRRKSTATDKSLQNAV